MRKLGFLLSSMLVLGAFMGLNAVSAFAAGEVWDSRCGDDPFAQSFEVSGFSLVTQERQELLSSAYTGRGRICGAWARAFNPDESTPDENGALTFAKRADIDVPPGVEVPNLRGQPDNLYAGNANAKILQWWDGYNQAPAIRNLPVLLYTSSRDIVDPDSSNPEDRKGCPPGPNTVVCIGINLAGLGANWVYTTTDDPSLPPRDQHYTTTIGEAFGAGAPARLASVVEIDEFNVCKNLGSIPLLPFCGDNNRPKIHLNGYAAVDDTCSDGVKGVYRVTAYNRNGDATPETLGSVSCMPWTPTP